MLFPARPDAPWAFARYESIRASLPRARFPETSVQADTLCDVFDNFDAFILDAYGVLNVGDRPVPGAAERLEQMRAAGKRIVVLTNGASRPRAQALAKYARLGLRLNPQEVIASRDVALATLPGIQGPWAAISEPGESFADFADVEVGDLHLDPTLVDRAGGFLFLGSQGWSAAKHKRLIAALRTNPRPVVVANPDVVAPLEGAFSLEPGHFGHDITAHTGIVPLFVGKPFGAVYVAALARLPGIASARIAMVGDTLHTDVLGGRAAGLGTVLVARHGLFRGLDPAPFITASAIVPDVIVETT
jgi:HAD superfamily hydrolase (TIGR01450 family)